MCKEEAEGVSFNSPLSWNSRFKWFTDDPKFLDRVSDGKFNNSKFAMSRYTHLAKYFVECPELLVRVSNSELMLSRRNAPMAKIKLLYLSAEL